MDKEIKTRIGVGYAIAIVLIVLGSTVSLIARDVLIVEDEVGWVIIGGAMVIAAIGIYNMVCLYLLHRNKKEGGLPVR